MYSPKQLFFAIVAISLAVAAALQIYIVYELDDICSGNNYSLTTAPAVAGISLATSFIANAIWLWKRKEEKSGARSAAILFWTLSVLIGVTAAGATMGQIQLYSGACPKGVASSTNFNAIQYISIVLMIFSIVAPHSLKKEVTSQAALLASQGGPEVGQLETTVKPLVFI